MNSPRIMGSHYEARQLMMGSSPHVGSKVSLRMYG